MWSTATIGPSSSAFYAVPSRPKQLGHITWPRQHTTCLESRNSPRHVRAELGFVTGCLCAKSKTRNCSVKTVRNSSAKAASVFCSLSPLWNATVVLLALAAPTAFQWITTEHMTFNLAVIVLSASITITPDDLKACFQNLQAVVLNFVCCFGVMPFVAYFLAKAIHAEPAILAGLVLVGSINGGQSSNLFALIAGGDVAMSVLMTTSTTLGCIFITPLIAKFVLGTMVPVHAMGIIISTCQVVLLPVVAGICLNAIAPRKCKGAGTYSPVIGVIAGLLNIGASVTKCEASIRAAGLSLQSACIALHLIGGLMGYYLARALLYEERICRTLAIETAMKSSAFGYLVASLHFGAFDVRVPSAVSLIWMNILGAALSVYWKTRPAQ